MYVDEMYMFKTTLVLRGEPDELLYSSSYLIPTPVSYKDLTNILMERGSDMVYAEK